MINILLTPEIKIDDMVDTFLAQLEHYIHEHLCNDADYDDYGGLDSDRDTERKLIVKVEEKDEVTIIILLNV